MTAETNGDVKCVTSFELDEDDSTPEKIMSVSDSVKKFMSLSIPAILSFFLIQIQDQISVLFIANMNDATHLAAIGLGNMMIIIIPYSIMIGVNTALETFVARAQGRNNLRDCGLYLHRAILIITLIYIPVTIMLF